MRFSLIFSAGLCAAATVPRQADNGCTNPVKRVEWRTLGAAKQKQYVDAVLCLKTKPSGMGLNTTRYDDFPYVHTKLNHESECFQIIFFPTQLFQQQRIPLRPHSPFRGPVSSLA